MTADFDIVLRKYLDILDDWQRKVDNIRKMHHEIWTASRVYPVIRQHRAGSRVEKQCRILPMGKQTDVDYKFEVKDIVVDMITKKELYWKVSPSSSAHGNIFVHESTKTELMNKSLHCDIFTENVFQWDCAENAYLLRPGQFKSNVVRISGFEYTQDATTTPNSPSIPGQGAVNEYDIVPCLRISQWPTSTYKWANKDASENKALNKRFRSNMIKNEDLFVVPAGNPSSPEAEREFRLSFSLVEVKCFEELSDYQRKLYGVLKYLFKQQLESVDLLDSYHVKSLFFSMLDKELIGVNIKDLIDDVFSFFKMLLGACKERCIKHIFIEECNIFPFHKKDWERKTVEITDVVHNQDKMIEELHFLVQRDLKITGNSDGKWISQAMGKIDELNTENRRIVYINGYLTRLLSLITYSLFENQESGKLDEAIRKIQDLFKQFTDDDNICRIIPIVNIGIEHLNVSSSNILTIDNSFVTTSSVDKISTQVHVAFDHYLCGKLQDAQQILDEITVNVPGNTHYIGLSITSFHKRYELDEALHHVISTLESKSKERKCPRFYMDPLFFAQHLKIQCRLKLRDAFPVQSDLDELESLSAHLSEREPYLGRLSYRYSAILLLQGYQSLLQRLELKFSSMDKEDVETFNQRLYATNFDLR
uniref:Uncharacterized protein LOC111134116 n=1 Tax=Crassostrea virginica TaxID=6565 RepID=A0A8B8EGP5_CRAVI|nr:uncharacterized protein LOC111134116 [Crassostrea virginica]